MGLDELRNKLQYLKNYMGITYAYIGKRTEVTGTDISHFVGGRSLPEHKINKLYNFIGGFMDGIKQR